MGNKDFTKQELELIRDSLEKSISRECVMLSKNKFVLPEDVDNLRILVELKCKVVTIEYEKELAEALNASLNA